MKKRKLLTLAVVSVVMLILAGVGSYVFAAGHEGQSSTETVIPVLGENVEMEVRPPLEVVTKWMGPAMDWQEGQRNPVYPGQVIGEGELTIRNVAPVPQSVYFYVQPIQIDGEVCPAFEIVTKSNDIRTWQIVLEPGDKIDLKIEVKVAYGSPVSSLFRGVELVVVAAPPPPPGLG